MNLKAYPGRCWKYTWTWLEHCLSETGPSLTGFHLRRLHVLGRTAKPVSPTNFYASVEYKILCSLPLKKRLSTWWGKPLDDAVYLALWKGLNYVAALAVLPIEDILTGVNEWMNKYTSTCPIYFQGMQGDNYAFTLCYLNWLYLNYATQYHDTTIILDSEQHIIKLHGNVIHPPQWTVNSTYLFKLHINVIQPQHGTVNRMKKLFYTTA